MREKERERGKTEKKKKKKKKKKNTEVGRVLNKERKSGQGHCKIKRGKLLLMNFHVICCCILRMISGVSDNGEGLAASV